MKKHSTLVALLISTLLLVVTVMGCKKTGTPRLSSINFYRTSRFFVADKFGENNFRVQGNIITFISNQYIQEYNSQTFQLKSQIIDTFDKITFGTNDTFYGFKNSGGNLYLHQLNIRGEKVNSKKVGSAPYDKNFAICINPDNKDVYVYNHSDDSISGYLAHYSRNLTLLNSKNIKFTNTDFIIPSNKSYNSVFNLIIKNNELYLFAMDNDSVLINKFDLNLNPTSAHKVSPTKGADYNNATYIFTNNEFKIFCYSSTEKAFSLGAYNTAITETKSPIKYEMGRFNAFWTTTSIFPCPFSNMIESDGKYYFIDNSQLFVMDENLKIEINYPIQDLIQLHNEKNKNIKIYAQTIVKTQNGITLILAAVAYGSPGFYFININKKGEIIN